MEKSVFESYNLVENEPISVLKLNGNTLYGNYKMGYDPKTSAFRFLEQGSVSETVLYLKEIQQLFKTDGL